METFSGFEYVIPKTETDTLVAAWPTWKEPDALLQGIPQIGGCLQGDNRFVFLFSFLIATRLRGPGRRFIEDFGMSLGVTETNLIDAQYAVINGEKFDFWIDPTGKVLDTKEESPCPFFSVAEKLSWGVLKQELIHLSKRGTNIHRSPKTRSARAWRRL